jgi:hypothetical protein
MASNACASPAPYYHSQAGSDGSYVVLLKMGVDVAATLSQFERKYSFTARMVLATPGQFGQFTASFSASTLESMRCEPEIFYISDPGVVIPFPNSSPGAMKGRDSAGKSPRGR